ncbi:hypothetical protein SAMN05421847_0403 [Halpernia humi]|uniref:Uncharacterized protein n=1 Tax=Halpernia humi TaxID=493375 RepID=A0A1H5T939_9FLAO|nr:hypothetical protein [Halpernia humi]SEF59296.1 hypothetical protein SAMN05421847_0403 [Halpernia humi]
MKNIFYLKLIFSFLFLSQISFLNAQDFTGKTEAEIAQLFVNNTKKGSDNSAAKAFNSNLLKYFKSISPPNVSIAIDTKMADVFKEIYKIDQFSSFRFIMTTEDLKAYSGMAPFLTAEQKLYLKETARAKINNYKPIVNNQNNAISETDKLYNGKGAFPQQFNKSNYTINFPRGTVNYSFSPIYAPRMKYKSFEVDTGFVTGLDYKYVRSGSTTYASVRFNPNITAYHLLSSLPENKSMVVMMIAINKLFPTQTYLKAKNEGGFYIITSDVKPIGWQSSYNVVKENGYTIIAKAHRNYGDKDLIVQIIRVKRNLKYESDMTADEKYFLNDAAVYKRPY